MAPFFTPLCSHTPWNATLSLSGGGICFPTAWIRAGFGTCFGQHNVAELMACWLWTRGLERPYVLLPALFGPLPLPWEQDQDNRGGWETIWVDMLPIRARPRPATLSQPTSWAQIHSKPRQDQPGAKSLS